jgi:hypothetical protein
VRSRRAVIDSHDTGRLRAVSARTRLVRIVLALAAIALLAAAVASARDLQVQPKGLLPIGTTGVVIVDLSLSIGDENLQDARKALKQVVDANEPILRLLAPPEGRPVQHPWNQGYRAGTKISQSLELAADMLRRDRISPGSILLLSDLDTAPDDYDKLARTLQTLRREFRIRVVPLSPTSEGRRLFSGSLGEAAITEPRELGGETSDAEPGIRGGTPTWLLVFGALCFVALAAHERFGARLALPAARRGR